MAKKALIPESFKKKQSELFEIDGTYFRVIYQPKAGLNRLEDWVEKLSKENQKPLPWSMHLKPIMLENCPQNSWMKRTRFRNILIL